MPPLYVRHVSSHLAVLKLTLSQTTLLSLSPSNEQASAVNFSLRTFVLSHQLFGTFAITFGSTIDTVLHYTLSLSILSLTHNTLCIAKAFDLDMTNEIPIDCSWPTSSSCSQARVLAYNTGVFVLFLFQKAKKSKSNNMDAFEMAGLQPRPGETS